MGYLEKKFWLACLQKRWCIYVFAFAISILVMLARAALGIPVEERLLLLIFLFPIALSACAGGLGPGLFSTVVVSLGAYYFFVPPQHSFLHKSLRDVFQVLLLIGSGAVLCFLFEALRRSRRRIEESRLQEREMKNELSKIAESVPGLLCTYKLYGDGTAAVPFATPLIEEVFGLTAESLSKEVSPWKNNVHPDDLPRAIDATAAAAKELRPLHLQYRYNHPSKGLRWIESWSVPRNEPDGSLIWHAYVMDITDHKNAEETLRQRNAWIDTILQASPAAIFTMDTNGIILSWSKGAERMFGWSEEEARGKFHPIVSEENKLSFLANLKKVHSGERLDRLELVRRKKDGSPICISVSAAPLYDGGGKVMGQIAVVLDITEHKKNESERAALEEQLRQSQKMEAVGQLAGGVAHDFNNILSAIVGYAQISLMGMEEKDPNRGNIEQIMTACGRATVLTQRLLTFSRKQSVNLVRCDLNDIVSRFENFFARLVREDIQFTTRRAEQPVPVMADRSQMEQVLLNLVANASDAMPNGGRITIEANVVHISPTNSEGSEIKKPGSYAVLSVLDSGTGIPEYIKDKIFDPFFTTKQPGKGTGLGLSMVYGTIKKHDGAIFVSNIATGGACFRIYLPLAAGSSEVNDWDEAIKTSALEGTETVLLAEDDPSVRAVSARVLRGYGYAVLEAVDGAEAVEVFQQNQKAVRLVVLDGIMPKKNGKEAWEEINTLSPGIKAIFISGYAEDIFTKDGIPDGQAVFIQKPVPPLALVRKIRDVLDK